MRRLLPTLLALLASAPGSGRRRGGADDRRHLPHRGHGAQRQAGLSDPRAATGNIWVALGNMQGRSGDAAGRRHGVRPGPRHRETSSGITSGPGRQPLGHRAAAGSGEFSPADPTTTGVAYAVPSADRGITTRPGQRPLGRARRQTGASRFTANARPWTSHGTRPSPGSTRHGGRGIAARPATDTPTWSTSTAPGS